MFTGTYEHALDEKGRVVLPATFRRRLGDPAVGYLAPLDGCLGLWDEVGFAAVDGRLRDRVRMGLAPKESLRVFFASAQEVSLDAQGRILVPVRLREVGGLDRELMVVGQSSHAELWDAPRWRQLVADTEFALIDTVLDVGLL